MWTINVIRIPETNRQQQSESQNKTEKECESKNEHKL